jgi:hypothetical protein
MQRHSLVNLSYLEELKWQLNLCISPSQFDGSLI